MIDAPGSVPRNLMSEAKTEPQGPSALAFATVDIAKIELMAKVRETTRNRGQRIDIYVKEGGGLDPEGQHPWCASFVSWCVLDAIKRIGGPWEFERGASVLKLRERNIKRLHQEPRIGAIWLRLDANLRGHCGIVTELLGHGFRAIEGNTGPGAAVASEDREGDGVYLRQRMITEATGGFLWL